LLFIFKWKLSQQQHRSRIQLGHSKGDMLTLQSLISQIQSAHFKAITIGVLIIYKFRML